MAKSKRTQDRYVSYNEAVLNDLREISPAHADALNSRGESLGWWPDIRYMSMQGKFPRQTAEYIATKTIPDRTPF